MLIGAARMKTALALLGLLGIACHGPPDVQMALDTSDPNLPRWVTMDPNALAERTITAADTLARAWGGSPGALDGWTIEFVDQYIEQHGDQVVVGKTRPTPVFGGGTIEIWVYTSTVCVEASVLAHEIGHVVIGDSDHRDWRWSDPTFWSKLGEEVAQGVPKDDPACLAQLASPAGGLWNTF